MCTFWIVAVTVTMPPLHVHHSMCTFWIVTMPALRITSFAVVTVLEVWIASVHRHAELSICFAVVATPRLTMSSSTGRLGGMPVEIWRKGRSKARFCASANKLCWRLTCVNVTATWIYDLYSCLASVAFHKRHRAETADNPCLERDLSG